jgi:isoaspartyl peptidase/L-asparaginase-like protein (Ntn-hydrolase superfamily)
MRLLEDADEHQTPSCDTAGAVACTGDGEFIALKILAREVYGWLEQQMPPDDAVQEGAQPVCRP